MNENLENTLSTLTENGIAELKVLLDELPPLEQRFLIGLLENLTLEEVWNLLNTMDTETDAVPCYHFVSSDPYFERKPILLDKSQRKIHFDSEGRICVRNVASCCLPELTLQRKIGVTIYSVSGTYEGMESLDKKLLRIMIQNAKNMEDCP